jgi:phenylpropionate dioxygenase-like ring-hydroxylating dioxygenase large terminal subunit
LYYKTNWLLIVDNLSDFAHLAFVHTNTLGGSEEYTYKTEPVASSRRKRLSTPPHGALIARTRRRPVS